MVAFTPPVFTVYNLGQVVSGAKVYAFETGTTTPVTTYSDAALTSPNAHPMTADANGQVTFFIGATTAIRLDLYTSDGTYIRTIDPIYPAANYTSGGSAAEAGIVSSSTTDLGSTGSNIVTISGSDTINSFGSSASTSTPLYWVRFTGTPTLTYNATSMQLPGGTNITVSAGDALVLLYLGSGNWKVVDYTKNNGTSLAVRPGTMFNLQQGTKTDTATSTSTSFADTGISVSITPTSATNKVLVRAVIQVSTQSNTAALLKLVRGSTDIGIGDAASSRSRVGASGYTSIATGEVSTIVLEWLDSPATTSATTYKVQWACSVGATTIYLNRAPTDTDASSYPRCVSTISVMEVQA